MSGGLPDVIETTDAAANAGTTYALGMGQTAQGQLGSVGDHDFYAVNLVAGETYTFALTGTGTNNVLDTFLRLYGPGGVSLVTSNNDGLQNENSIITFTANTSGTYYLDASSANSGTGQYGLSATIGSKASVDLSMGAGIIDTDLSWSVAPGTPAIVTYGFRLSTNGDSPQFQQLTAAQIAAVQAVLQLWADVAGITFQQVNPGGFTNNATILFASYSANDGAGAYAYYPGDPSAAALEGDVWLNRQSVSTSSLPVGSYSFETIVHEIGHAIGLSHPGLYNAAPGVSITYAADAQFVQDTIQYSVMSYFEEFNSDADFGTNGHHADTPMILDVYALQQIYGANMSTRVGDTVYGFGSTAGAVFDFNTNSTPALCIWDAGGTDTLNLSGFSQAQMINLAAGSFSNVGGLISNVSIALGVTLENVTGGSGADDIYLAAGNVNNLINGSGGTDIAHVTYEYGSGYTLSGTAVDLTISGAAGTDEFQNVEYFIFSDGSQITAANLIAGGPLATPDLTVGTVSVSDLTPAASQVVTVSSLISNLDVATTGGSFLVGIYLSTDATIDTGDTLLGDQTLSALAGLASIQQTLNVTLPGSVVGGLTYYIGVIADYTNVIAGETSEANNASIGTAVQISQDPVFTQFADVQTLLQPGGPWHALGGNDTVTGSSGVDIIFGDDGDDTIQGGGGADQLFGGLGIDTVSYANSSLGVTVSLLLKSKFAQTSAGDASGDKLDTVENVIGSEHNDTLTGAKLGGVLSGLGGNDTLTGGGGTNTLDGGEGNDTLIGGKGANTLNGGADNDTLLGGKGIDVLIGGLDDDLITGAKGNDHFVFDAGFGHDTLTDFAVGKKITDVIEFDSSVFANFADVQSHMQQVGSTVVITTVDGDTVTLQNVQLAALTANHFLIT